MLILVFSVKLDWFPFVFRTDLQATGLAWWWQEFKQSIMPILVIGLFQGASLVRYVRSSMLDVIKLDYVTTARSKGIGSRRVLMRHVVRNGLIPVVTLVAVQLPHRVRRRHHHGANFPRSRDRLVADRRRSWPTTRRS